MLRRPNQNTETHPVIGVLPVGRENTFGEKLFKFTNSSNLQRVQGLADASLSIVRGNIEPKDVIKIEIIDDESNVSGKPVYALSGYEWSAFTDAFNELDRYWYFGSLRNYMTFIFNAFSNSITWNCAATITYTEPCSGCNNCYLKPNQLESKPVNRRWWSGFIPSFRLGSSQSGAQTPNYAKIYNPNCIIETEIECDSAGIIVNSANIESKPDETRPHITLKIINGQDGFSFISDSWNRLNNNQISLDVDKPIRTVKIVPKPREDDTNSDKERFIYIDRESYEIKPIRITLLPKFVNFYSS